MATRIAIDPTKITNMSFRRYDKTQNIPFEDLFVQKPDGELIYLNDLQIGVTADTKIKTTDEFFKNFNKLQYEGTNIVDMGFSMEDVFYRATTHTDVSSNHTSIASLSLTNGASRTYSLAHKSELAPGERRYGNDVVFIGRLRGNTQDTIMEAGDIYYIHPLTKSRINLIELENVLKPSFKNFTHAVYMYEDKDGVSREIESIDLRNAYTCKLTTYETKKENGMIETHTFDEDGNDSVTDVRSTTASFVDKTVIAGNDEKGTTLIQNKLFNRSENGEFVAVQVKGQDHLIKVSLADLYDNEGNQIVPEGAELSSQEFDALKGLELQIKTETGKMLEIEPLTVDNERYSTQKVLDISHNSEDIMAENAYLKLTNGQMFHESESNIQPKAYNIIDSSNNADAYLIRLSSGQYRIIDKTLFEKEKLGPGKSYTIDGKVVRIDQVFKMGRTYAANAAVYQMSSTFRSKIHLCKLVKKLREFDSLPDDFNEEQVRSEAKEEFIESYKSGSYVLDKVEILDEHGNLKLQDIATNKEEKGERYIYTDTFYTEDNSQKLGYYAALDNKPVEIQIKDGKISYAKGGPNYSITKGIKRDFAVWGTVALNSLGIFSTGGLAVAIVAPGLVAAGLAGVIAAPVIMPIVEIGRGIVSRISNAVKKSAWRTNVDLKKLDKNQDINHQTIAEIEQGMDHIKSQTETKLAEIDGDKTLTDEAKDLAKQDVLRKLNLECGLLQQKVATLSGSTIEGSTFTITDGKGNVSSYNAYQCLMFQKQFNEKVDEKNAIDKSLKGISARLAKGKELKKGQAKALDSLIEKYFSGKDFVSDNAKVEALQTISVALNSELEGMQQNFTSGSYQAPPDSRYQEILDRSKNMQAYLIAKIHGVQLEDGTKVDNFMDNSLDIANLQNHMNIIEEIKRDIGEFDFNSILASTPAEAKKVDRRDAERQTGAGLGAKTDLETEIKPIINLDDEEKKEDESSSILQIEDIEDIKSVFMGLSPSFDAIKNEMDPIWDETLSEMNALEVTPESIDSVITYLNNQDNISEDNSDLLAKLNLVRFKYDDFVSDSTKFVDAIEKQESIINQLNENSNIDSIQIETAYSELVSVCEELAEKYGVEIKIDVPKIEILSTVRQAEDAADAMRALTEPSDDNLSLVHAFKMMKSGAIDESFIDMYPHHIRDIGERCSRYQYFEKLKGKESINITINGEKITLTRDEAKQMQDNFAKINSVLKGEKEEKTGTELDIALIRTLIAKMTDLEKIHKKFAGPDEELLGNEEDLATDLREFYDVNHAIFDKALSSESISAELKEDIKQAIEYYNHYGDYYPIGYKPENNDETKPQKEDINSNNNPPINPNDVNKNDDNNVVPNLVKPENTLDDQVDDDDDNSNDDSNSYNDRQPSVHDENGNGVDPNKINEVIEESDESNKDDNDKDDSADLNANEKISRLSKIKAKLSSVLESIKSKKEEHKAQKQEKKNSKKDKENLLDEESKLKLGEKILQLGSKLKNASISTGKAIKSAGLKTISAVKTAGVTAGNAIKNAGITAGKGIKTAAGAVAGVAKGAASKVKGVLNKKQITFASIVDELKSEDFDAEAFFNRHSDKTITEIKHVLINQVKPAMISRKKAITRYKNNQNSQLIPPSPIIEHGGVEFNVNEFDSIMKSINELSKYELTLNGKKIKKSIRETLVYDKEEEVRDWQHAVADLASESFDSKNFLEKYEYRISKEAEKVVLIMKMSFDRQRKQQIADEENRQKAAAGGYEYNSTFVWQSTLKYGDMSFDEDKVTRCVQSLEKIQQYQKDKKTSVATNNENADESSGISEERISEIENADSTDQENKGRSRKKKRKEDKTREIQDAKQEAEDKRKQADIDAISAIKDDKLRKLCQDLLSETGIFVNDLIDKYSDVIDKLSIVLSSKHSVSQDGLFDILTFDNNEIVEISLKGYQQIIKNMQILIEAKKERENKKVEEWSQRFVDSVDQINNILDKNNPFEGLTLGNFYEPAYNQLIAGLDKLDSKKQLEFVEKYEKVLDYIKYKISDPLITTQILENDQAVVNLSDSYQVTITQETLKKLLEEFKNVDEIKSNRAFTQ